MPDALQQIPDAVLRAPFADFAAWVSANGPQIELPLRFWADKYVKGRKMTEFPAIDESIENLQAWHHEEVISRRAHYKGWVARGQFAAQICELQAEEARSEGAALYRRRSG